MTRNDKKPLYSSNLDHYGSIIFNSEKNVKYLIKIEVSMFDQDKDPKVNEYHYLDCKAGFLHFSSKCLNQNLAEMLQCNRGDQQID